MIQKFYDYKKIEKFILLQPIIDIFTSFMVRFSNLPITVGTIIRGLFFLYALIYLMFYDRKERLKNNRIYIILIGLFCIINLVLVYYFKNNINILTEIINLFKLFYFPLILLFFYAFYSENENKFNIKTFVKVSILISFSILIARVTNTVNFSYGTELSGKIGHSGWFNSSNEIGSLLAILFPVLIYNIVKEKDSYSYIYTSLLIYGLFCIGTKVAYLSMIICLFLYLFSFLSDTVFFKKKFSSIKGKLLKPTIVVLSLIIVTTPFTPIFHNMNIHFKSLNINFSDILNKNSDATKEEEIENLIFYGREDYLRQMKDVYRNSNISQKFFGIGRQNNYIEDIKVTQFIERDFHDVFYYYGIFGFILFMTPIFYIAYKIIKTIWINKKLVLRDDIKLLIISISLLISIAFMAGHTLLSPAVATFGALIIAMLNRRLLYKEE